MHLVGLPPVLDRVVESPAGEVRTSHQCISGVMRHVVNKEVQLSLQYLQVLLVDLLELLKSYQCK